MQRLHVKWYRCEPKRFQSICKAAGVPARACGLVPHVMQTCQVGRSWKRPSQSDKFTYGLALAFQEDVQFDIRFYHSALQPGLGGETGIPIVHLIDCCIQWAARMLSHSCSTMGLFDCMPVAWVNVFGGMQVLSLDGETGVGSTQAGAWVTCSQATLKHKTPHQQAWLVERHDALMRSALRFAEAQVM